MKQPIFTLYVVMSSDVQNAMSVVAFDSHFKLTVHAISTLLGFCLMYCIYDIQSGPKVYTCQISCMQSVQHQ